MFQKFSTLIKSFLIFWNAPNREEILKQLNTKGQDSEGQASIPSQNPKSPEEIGLQALKALGMDTLPFTFEESKTAPEREVDFLIEHKNDKKLFEYFKAGYEFNQKQLSNMLAGQIIVNIKYWPASDKKIFLEKYSAPVNDIIEQCVHWSKTCVIPDSELLSLANKEQAKDWLNKKEEVYRLLDYIFEYLPEIYTDNLEEFHKKNAILKQTKERLDAVESNYDDYLFNHYKRQCFNKLRDIIPKHAALYDRASAKSIGNLQLFISTATELNSAIKSSTHQSLTEIEDNKLVYAHLGITHTQFKKLPIEAQNKLQQISSLVSSISEPAKLVEPPDTLQNTQIDNTTEALPILNIEQKLFIQNVCQKEIPQIIEQFGALTSTEKEKFKSPEGKTVEVLLMEALSSIEHNIQNLLTAHTEQKSQEKFNNIQVSHRYLVSKKF